VLHRTENGVAKSVEGGTVGIQDRDFGVTLFIGVALATAERTPGVGIDREFVAMLTRGIAMIVGVIVRTMIAVLVIGIAITVFVVFILIVAVEVMWRSEREN